MGQHEGEVQAACFGEGVVEADGQVQQVVAFVGDQGRVEAVGFGLVGAGGGGV